MTFEEFETRAKELIKRLVMFNFFIFRETNRNGGEVLEGIAERADLVRADFEPSRADPAGPPKVAFWLNFRLAGPTPKPYVKKLLTYDGTGHILRLHAQDGSMVTMFKVDETDEPTMEIIRPLREARELARHEHDQVSLDLIKKAQEMIANGQGS